MYNMEGVVNNGELTEIYYKLNSSLKIFSQF